MHTKFIYFTDVQIHDYKNYNLDGKRLANCLEVISDVAEAAIQHKANGVLFSGDLVDQQKHIKKIVSNYTQDALRREVKRSGCNWYAISGNHDHETKNLQNFKAVSFLDGLPSAIGQGFIVLDRFQESTNAPLSKDVQVFGIEYFEYAEHFQKELEYRSAEAKKSKAKFKILMIHQTPKGIDGMAEEDTYPEDPLYAAFDLILDGHIPQKQWLTPKFLVGGSPLHRDLADMGQDNGYYVFTVDSSSKTFTYEFVSLNHKYPIFTYEATKENDFVITKPEAITGGLTLKLEHSIPNDFRSDLTPKTLVENYWKEVNGKDKELLKVGLACV